MTESKSWSVESVIAQAGHHVDNATGGIVPPIQPSTTYARDREYEPLAGYTYSRERKPTRDDVEHLAAALDRGAAALAFSSGLAAVAAVFETVSTGRHIVAQTQTQGEQVVCLKCGRLFQRASPSAPWVLDEIGSSQVRWYISCCYNPDLHL